MIEQDVLRWYTPALRIPKFLGKLPSGERLPGGPYTQAQGATFATVVVVAGVTRQWWSALLPQGQAWGLVSYALVLGLGVAAGLAARFTPRTSMNPVAIAGGALGQIFRSTGQPTGGCRRGDARRVVQGVVTITTATTTSDGVPPVNEAGAPSPASADETSSAGAGKAMGRTTRLSPSTPPPPLARTPARPVTDGGITAKLAELVAAAPGSGSDRKVLQTAGRS